MLMRMSVLMMAAAVCTQIVMAIIATFYNVPLYECMRDILCFFLSLYFSRSLSRRVEGELGLLFVI